MSFLSEHTTVLVNSSDGFDDCWSPFFTLLSRYWPELDCNILLNTETKDYTFSDLNVRATRVAVGEDARLPWSECLIRALGEIDTPILLYFQEDYFLDRPVAHKQVADAVKHMLDNPGVGNIALTKHGPLPPYETYSDDSYEKVRQNARYRISTQAGLWRKETLLEYLISQENGWMFEIFGTWRAQRGNEVFLVCKPIDGDMPIDYVHTGIVKGKWLNAVPAIFDKNNIEMDYAKRGFYEPKSFLFHKFEVFRKLTERPGYFLRQFFNFS